VVSSEPSDVGDCVVGENDVSDDAYECAEEARGGSVDCAVKEPRVWDIELWKAYLGSE
jgi:hypothetical protein